MNTKKRLLIGIFAILFALSMFILFSYNNGYYKVNGFVTKDLNSLEGVIKHYSEKQGIFDDDKLDNRFVTYTFDTSKLDNVSDFTKFVDKITHEHYDFPISFEINEEELKTYIKEYNKDRTDAKNAEIIKGKKEYEISKEKEGTKIDYDALLKATKKERHIVIDDFNVKPEIVSSDLEERLNELNSFVNWSVKYKNDKKIKASIDNVDYDSKTDTVTLNYDFIIEKVNSDIAPSYNTVGIERTFKNHNGDKMKVSGGTFGTTIDSEKEIEELKTLFDKAKSKKKREPILALNLKEIGDTYIEVSKDAQHLWLVKKGKVVKDSPVVTGCTGKGRGTPSGVFYVSEKIPGKYLVGDGYKTWVNRWMRLTNTGVGLHDANWRGAFGGTIYKYNGSHGCINLPSSFAYWLYDNIDREIPVIIY